jgi:hypothetical protein
MSVPLQLIITSESNGNDILTSKPLQALHSKDCMAFSGYKILFHLVTPSQVIKTAASLAERGFGGFRYVKLSLSYRETPSQVLKTAVSLAVKASQRKNCVRTVTEYYSTLVTVTRTHLHFNNAVAQLSPKQAFGGCHA